MINIKEKINALDEKFDTAFFQVDAMTRELFIDAVMKEDGITRDEVLRKIETDPMYSMGLKTVVYRNRRKLDLRTPRKIQKEKFLASLTPEELRLYNEGPNKGFFALKKQEREARKEAMKKAEVLKRKIENGEEIHDDDIPEDVITILRGIQGDGDGE